jgi:hypothetical protein
MRLVVQRGMVTPESCLSFRVTQAKPPRGTDVAMVGMRAAGGANHREALGMKTEADLPSCHPMPVLMMEAPAPSIALASCGRRANQSRASRQLHSAALTCTISGHTDPSGMRSSMLSR